MRSIFLFDINHQCFPKLSPPAIAKLSRGSPRAQTQPLRRLNRERRRYCELLRRLISARRRSLPELDRVNVKVLWKRQGANYCILYCCTPTFIGDNLVGFNVLFLAVVVKGRGDTKHAYTLVKLNTPPIQSPSNFLPQVPFSSTF